LQANKKHSFHTWRKLSEGRRCQSPERSEAAGRGSEHGVGVVYAPRRAAQAGLTGGAEGSSRLRLETNVARKDQRKAEPKSWGIYSRHCSPVAPGRVASPSAIGLCVGKEEADEIRADGLTGKSNFINPSWSHGAFGPAVDEHLEASLLQGREVFLSHLQRMLP
jgi:hypothetical protein